MCCSRKAKGLTDQEDAILVLEIEIKAPCKDLAKLESILLRRGAEAAHRERPHRHHL
jgi:hypothetical protein